MITTCNELLNFVTRQTIVYQYLLFKVQCFIKISSTDKIDNLKCEIMTRENYRFSNNQLIASGCFILVENTVVYIINRKIGTLRVHVSAKKRYATRAGGCAQHKYVAE